MSEKDATFILWGVAIGVCLTSALAGNQVPLSVFLALFFGFMCWVNTDSSPKDGK